jgi:hypothetical protein
MANTLSLHDALPISAGLKARSAARSLSRMSVPRTANRALAAGAVLVAGLAVIAALVI